MKKTNYNDILHVATNESILEILKSIPNARFISKLDDVINERGISQIKLSKLTGLRQATISEFINGEKSSISKAHILTLMIALRVTDIKELIDVEFEPEIQKQFEAEAREWKEYKSIPASLHETFNKNIERSFIK